MTSISSEEYPTVAQTVEEHCRIDENDAENDADADADATTTVPKSRGGYCGNYCIHRWFGGIFNNGMKLKSKKIPDDEINWNLDVPQPTLKPKMEDMMAADEGFSDSDMSRDLTAATRESSQPSLPLPGTPTSCEITQNGIVDIPPQPQPQNQYQFPSKPKPFDHQYKCQYPREPCICHLKSGPSNDKDGLRGKQAMSRVGPSMGQAFEKDAPKKQSYGPYQYNCKYPKERCTCFFESGEQNDEDLSRGKQPMSRGRPSTRQTFEKEAPMKQPDNRSKCQYPKDPSICSLKSSQLEDDECSCSEELVSSITQEELEAAAAWHNFIFDRPIVVMQLDETCPVPGRYLDDDDYMQSASYDGSSRCSTCTPEYSEYVSAREEGDDQSRCPTCDSEYVSAREEGDDPSRCPTCGANYSEYESAREEGQSPNSEKETFEW
ncbi:unnamed protein product [Ambrosiozyma monospora]|uniref:Unnamed protein product n=1 Tax=Ambrosiozyma monospora TaxID=43982 RepID=A0A9W7DHV8_AMBMO|nr:unnamed protein product [Ambrosiozyma monospora]